jgi:electron transport complex protein RnfE
MGLATTVRAGVLLRAGVADAQASTPKEVRIAVYIVIIATFVTVVDYVIQAVSLAVYDALGAFIQLIVVNCIILGRAEAHASKHPPITAMVNAMGMSLGFVIGLFALGAVREVLGAGTLFGRIAVRRRQFPALGGDGAAAWRLHRAGRVAAAVLVR